MSDVKIKLASMALIKDGVLHSNREAEAALYETVRLNQAEVKGRLAELGLMLRLRPDLGVAVAQNMSDEEMQALYPDITNPAKGRLYQTVTMSHWQSILYITLRGYWDDDLRGGVDGVLGWRPEEDCLRDVQPYYREEQQDDETSLERRTQNSLASLADKGFAEMEVIRNERFWRATERGMATFSGEELSNYVEAMKASLAQLHENEQEQADREAAATAQGDLL